MRRGALIAATLSAFLLAALVSPSLSWEGGTHALISGRAGADGGFVSGSVIEDGTSTLTQSRVRRHFWDGGATGPQEGLLGLVADAYWWALGDLDPKIKTSAPYLRNPFFRDGGTFLGWRRISPWQAALEGDAEAAGRVAHLFQDLANPDHAHEKGHFRFPSPPFPPSSVLTFDQYVDDIVKENNGLIPPPASRPQRSDLKSYFITTQALGAAHPAPENIAALPEEVRDPQWQTIFGDTALRQGVVDNTAGFFDYWSEILQSVGRTRTVEMKNGIPGQPPTWRVTAEDDQRVFPIVPIRTMTVRGRAYQRWSVSQTGGQNWSGARYRPPRFVGEFNGDVSAGAIAAINLPASTPGEYFIVYRLEDEQGRPFFHQGLDFYFANNYWRKLTPDQRKDAWLKAQGLGNTGFGGGYYVGRMWNGTFHVDPTFIQPSSGEPIAERFTGSLAASLVAHVSAPRPGNLVRASVPIYGVAGGASFARYVIEAAPISAPDSWALVAEGVEPETTDVVPENLMSGDAPIIGNLGSWPTGLTEYPYPFDPNARDLGVDGAWVLRLRVFDADGGYAEDTVAVRVGRVLGRSFASAGVSEDGAVRLDVPAFALPAPFQVVGVYPTADAPPPPAGASIVEGPYEVLPAGLSFVEPARIVFTETPTAPALRVHVAGADGLWRPAGRYAGLSADVTALPQGRTFVALMSDVVPPDTPVLFPVSFAAGIGPVVSGGAGEPGATVEVYLNDDLQAIRRVDELGFFAAPLGPVVLGSNEIAVQSFDASNVPGPEAVEAVEAVRPPAGGSLVLETEGGIPRPGVTINAVWTGEDAPAPLLLAHVRSTRTDPMGFNLPLVRTAPGRYEGLVVLDSASKPRSYALAAGAEGEEIVVDAEDVAGATIAASVLVSDRTPPSEPRITSATHPVLYAAGFGDGAAGWMSLSGAAAVEWAPIGLGDSGIHVHAADQPGVFGARAPVPAYDAAEFPLLSFRYEFPFPTGVNLYLRQGDRWYEIVVADPDEKRGMDPELVRIGAVDGSGVAPGGGLGLARLNVAQMLSGAGAPSTRIDEIRFAAFDGTGYKRLDPALVAPGEFFLIDDFAVYAPGPKETGEWRAEASDASGVARYRYDVVDEAAFVFSDLPLEAADGVIRVAPIEGASKTLLVAAVDANGLRGPMVRIPIAADSVPPTVNLTIPVGGSVSRLRPFEAALLDSDAGQYEPGISASSIRVEMGACVFTPGDPRLSFEPFRGLLRVDLSDDTSGSLWSDGTVLPVHLTASDWAGRTVEATTTVVYRDASIRLEEVSLAKDDRWVEVSARGPVDLREVFIESFDNDRPPLGNGVIENGRAALELGKDMYAGADQIALMDRHGRIFDAVAWASPGEAVKLRALEARDLARLVDSGAWHGPAALLPEPRDLATLSRLRSDDADAAGDWGVGFPTRGGENEAADYRPGDLVIDEVCASEDAGVWVEIRAPRRPIRLDRVRVMDLDGDQRGQVLASTPTTLSPGRIALVKIRPGAVPFEKLRNVISLDGIGETLARRLIEADPSLIDRLVEGETQAVLPITEEDEFGDLDGDGVLDVVIPGFLSLGPGDDQVVLEGPNGFIDAFVWSSIDGDDTAGREEVEDVAELTAAGLWPDTNLVRVLRLLRAPLSFSRKAGASSPGDPLAWGYGRPTPGLSNEAFEYPKRGEVLVNELHPNRPDARDADWAEIVNVTDRPIDVSPLVLTDLDGEDQILSPGGPLTLAPGEYAVARWGAGVTESDGVGDTNGNGYRDVYLADQQLFARDQLALLAGGEIVDAVWWGGIGRHDVKDIPRLEASGAWKSIGQPVMPTGLFMGRIPDRVDSDRREDWDGNVAPTPGRPNLSAADDHVPPVSRLDADPPLFDDGTRLWASLSAAYTVVSVDDLWPDVEAFYRIDQEGRPPNVGFRLFESPFFLSPGTHVIEIYGVDPSGNVEAVKRVEVTVDVEPPVSRAERVDATHLRVTATDSGSGVAGVEAAVESGPFTLAPGAEVTIDLPEDAAYVRFRATDRAGNREATKAVRLAPAPAGPVRIDEIRPGVDGDAWAEIVALEEVQASSIVLSDGEQDAPITRDENVILGAGTRLLVVFGNGAEGAVASATAASVPVFRVAAAPGEPADSIPHPLWGADQLVLKDSATGGVLDAAAWRTEGSRQTIQERADVEALVERGVWTDAGGALLPERDRGMPFALSRVAPDDRDGPEDWATIPPTPGLPNAPSPEAARTLVRLSEVRVAGRSSFVEIEATGVTDAGATDASLFGLGRIRSGGEAVHPLASSPLSRGDLLVVRPPSAARAPHRCDDHLVLWYGPHVIDAVVWSDRDGEVSTDDAKDYLLLVEGGHWTGPTTEEGAARLPLRPFSLIRVGDASEAASWATGFRPTPGETNVVVPVPAPGEVLINEVAANRPDEPDVDWAELVNVADRPFDVGVLVLSDLQGPDEILSADAPLTLGPGDRAVVHWLRPRDADGVTESDDVGDADGNGYRDVYVRYQAPVSTEDLPALRADGVFVDAVRWLGRPSTDRTIRRRAARLAAEGAWLDGADPEGAVPLLHQVIGRIPDLADSNRKADWQGVTPTPGAPNVGAGDDREPPRSRLDGDPGLSARDGVVWARLDTRFFFRVEEETSAFATVLFQVDGESPTAPSSEIATFQVFDGGRFFLDPPGPHVVYHFGEDAFGNREEVRRSEVRFDATPPATSLSGGCGASILLTAVDAEAGVYGIVVEFDVPGSSHVYLGETAAVAVPAGATTVTFYAVDLVGVSEEPRTVPVARDAAAPQIGVASPAPGGRYVAKRDEIVIDFTVLDDLDPNPGVVAFLTDLEEGARRDVWNGERIDPLSIDDGAWQLTVIAQDCAGNANQVVVGPFEVVHDVRPPRTSLTVGVPQAVGAADGAAPGETFVTAATSFTLAAVDDLIDVGDGIGLGVAATYYAIDGGAEQAGTAFTLAGLVDGEHAVSYRSVDVVGNEEAARTASVRLDNTAPAITVTIGTPKYVAGVATYVTSATLIAATATDAGVGLATFDSPVLPLAEGVRVLTYRAVDLLGNEAETSITVAVDNTPPTTSLTVDVKDTSGTVLIPESLITLEAADGPPGAASGVAATTFSIDGETAQVYATPFMPRTVVPGGLAYGPHAITFSSVDNLGNAETTRTFAFTLSPALEVTRRIDHGPRVLLWWNAGETPVATVEAALTSGALTIDTVTAKDTFVAAMRSAAHIVYVVVGEAERLSSSEAEELAAHVDAGAGLVAFEYDRIDGPMLGHDRREGTEDVARDNVLGVRVAGRNGTDLTVEVVAGILSDETSTFTATGASERVRNHVGNVPGVFTDAPNETPAITFRRYGAGTAIYVDFAAASTPAEVLGRLVGLATPETQPIVPGGVVVLAIDVKSLVVPLDLTVRVEEMLPAGAMVLDVRPAPQSQQPHLITWYVVLDVGEETSLAYSIEAPAGTAEPEAIVSYLVRGGYYEFGRFEIDVTARSRDDLAGSAADSLYVFAATLPTQGGDRQRVENAAAKVAAIENATFTSADGIEAAIKDVLDAVEAVTRTEDPAGEPIRGLLDALVATLGREWNDASR